MSSGGLLKTTEKKSRKPPIVKVHFLFGTRVLVDRRTAPRRYQLHEIVF
jgi:hypothetical protein